MSVTLANGTRRAYAWDYGGTFDSAPRAALTWTRRELTREKVKGRSHMARFSVTVEETDRPWRP